MLNIQLASKYATAVFEIAKEENNLDGYDKDLAKVRADVFAIPEAVKFFQNPLIPQQAKKDLLVKAFDKEISATVMNFLMLLVDKKRIGVFNRFNRGRDDGFQPDEETAGRPNQKAHDAHGAQDSNPHAQGRVHSRRNYFKNRRQTYRRLGGGSSARAPKFTAELER